MTTRSYRPGIEARRAILTELRRCEDAGERATVRALALALGIGASTIGSHVAVLRAAGMIDAQRGRYGRLTLTAAGRIATD